MRNQRNILLAGIATLALVAGSGFASAQETSPDHNGATQGKEPHAATHQMNQGPGPGKMGQTQSQERQTPGGQAQQNDQNSTSAKMNAGQKTTAQSHWHKQGANVRGSAENQWRNGRKSTTAQQQRRNGGPNNTAQRERNGMEGLQGNASGMNVQLNDEQRTQIRNTVIEARGAPRVDHVNFDVTVGSALPRSGVRVVPVPETLVRIEPAWRGFHYFVYEQEVVIVDPRNMRIVAVLTM
jgi:Protein of unknown function (DUF1236)